MNLGQDWQESRAGSALDRAEAVSYPVFSNERSTSKLTY